MKQSSITEQEVRTILSTIPYPGFTRDIVSFGVVRGITVGDELIIQMVLSTNERNAAYRYPA